MKQVKRFFYLSFALLILLEGVMGSQPGRVYAETAAQQQQYAKLAGFVRKNVAKKTMTRKQVNAKISSLEQQIKTLKAQKKTEKAREKKERAGAKYLYAEVICTSPYILYDTLSSGYFWVNDRQYLDNLWVAAMGYVKLTGNYRTYNGITCAECNSVKVVNKSSGIQTKIDSKKKALKKYKNALKDKVSLQNAKVKAGKTVKIIKEWKYSGAYNALAWKSSDEDIASVDANGKVTAYKEGTVTISAKAGVSGITGKCKVTVWEEDTAPSQDQEEEYGGTWEDAGGSADQGVTESEMHFERQDYYLEDARSATLYLYVNLKEGDDPGSISVTSSDENVAVFSEGGRDRDNRCVLIFTLTGAGTTTITATADLGLSAQCTLTHYIDME